MSCEQRVDQKDSRELVEPLQGLTAIISPDNRYAPKTRNFKDGNPSQDKEDSQRKEMIDRLGSQMQFLQSKTAKMEVRAILGFKRNANQHVSELVWPKLNYARCWTAIYKPHFDIILPRN